MASKNKNEPKGPVFWIVTAVCVLIGVPFVIHLIALCAVVAFTLLNPSSKEDIQEQTGKVERQTPQTVEQSEWANDFRPAVEIEQVANQYSPYPVYELKNGETIYGVARKLGVAPEKLLKANGITDPTNIPIGTRLKIPVQN